MHQLHWYTFEIIHCFNEEQYGMHAHTIRYTTILLGCVCGKMVLTGFNVLYIYMQAQMQLCMHEAKLKTLKTIKTIWLSEETNRFCDPQTIPPYISRIYGWLHYHLQAKVESCYCYL
jgi:hypothetical protein